MTYDQDDLDSIALCAWKEARGEGTPGMLAVMHVIYNRALAWYGGARTEGQEENECVHHAVRQKPIYEHECTERYRVQPSTGGSGCKF